MPFTFPVEASPMAVGQGPSKIITAQLIAPGSPTAYSDNDAVGTGYLTFQQATRTQGGSGMIVHAEIAMGFSPSGTFSAKLWLFNQPPIAQVDNDPFVKDANMLNSLVSVIDLSTLVMNSALVPRSGVQAIATSLYSNACCGLNRSYSCAANRSDLYGVLVATSAFTPSANGIYRINLHVVQ